MNVLSASDIADTRRAMRISVVAGVAMLVIKFMAYFWTNSSAILSDAAESVVHIIAVLFAAYSLWLSVQPPDEQHPYGHAKISFFSAGVEGTLILIAAIVIIYTAAAQWIAGLALRNLDLGAAMTALAAGLNAGLGWYLVRVGRRRNSIILEANGKHVLTDSWTSFGVVAGLFLAWTTGWLFLDPVCAILVAINIMFSAADLIRRSVSGLMDKADPGMQKKLMEILDRECRVHQISHHMMRQRFNGQSYDVDLHLLFPDDMKIKDAHRIATAIENRIESEAGASVHITSHLEPHDDHARMHPG